MFLRKYGTGTGADVIIPIIKRGVVDFAVTADWTPASGDVKVSKDGGTEANIATLPVINGTVGWRFVFSDAELQCKSLTVRVVDSATKAVEDQFFIVETYGNASAMFQSDLAAAQLTANVTHFGGSAGTFGSGLPTVNLAANQDVRNVGGTLPAVTLAASQPNYAPLTSLGTNAPAGWLNAAAFASGSLNGKGDWANVGAAMTLTSGERSAVAAACDLALINAADGANLIGALADAIAADWVAGDASPLAIVAAMKADATLATMIGRIDVANSTRLAASGYTAPDNSGIAAVKVVTDRINTGLVADGGVWQFTAKMLELGLTGGRGGTGDASQETVEEVLGVANAIAAALGGAPVEPTGTNIRDQLQEIYDGLFPEDPDTDPVVITPGTGDITTGWMVCLDETGEAEKDVQVYCQMSDVPASETGFAHSSRIQTAISATNGVVEFSLVKGASYFFWRGKASPNGTLDPVAIPSDAGSTYELPSIKAIV